MLLRNYDNFSALHRMVGIQSIQKIFEVSSNFGDGYLSFKLPDGSVSQKTKIIANTCQEPFQYFYGLGGWVDGMNSNGQSYLVCGYEEGDVTYDDYTIENGASSLNFVNHSTSTTIVNENNELESVYSKTLYNSSDEDVVINCLGVKYATPFYGEQNSYLVYKEKIPEITIPVNGNVVITFTTKIPLGQNKPTDYVATASVE